MNTEDIVPPCDVPPPPPHFRQHDGILEYADAMRQIDDVAGDIAEPYVEEK